MSYTKAPTTTFPSYSLASAATATVSGIASGTVTTSAAHGLTAGQAFQFSALSGATDAGVAITYYVVDVPSTTTFTFATTRGGTAIATAAASSGAITLGQKLSISILELLNLTSAEANASTGDIRSVMESLLGAFYAYNNALPTADKSTKMSVYKSVSTDTGAGTTTASYTSQFIGTTGAFEVASE